MLKSDLTGWGSFHDIERNINWTHSGKSEMTVNYENYGITRDNILRKELELEKRASIMPYGGVKVMYGIRPTFSEKGLEALDLSYEYELSDFNEREYARLTAVEDSYHRLAKPDEENGAFKTKATLGVEMKDRYGVSISGEYKTGESGNDDYRAGINQKAVF